jgi:hypothetical protein
MLGKYQLIAELARGGMAIVYLARVQGPGGFNKLVVVKELKPEPTEESGRIPRPRRRPRTSVAASRCTTRPTTVGPSDCPNRMACNHGYCEAQ